MGATAIKDGASTMSWPSNISSTPVEIAEREAPLLFRNKMLRPDSGGTGQFRGGLGQDICFVSVHSKPMSIVFRSEEQTSELQSLMRISYAVFYLKKQNI